MAERSDAPSSDDDDIPSGLPEGGDEPSPMGAVDGDPDGEGGTPRGQDAQPGIPEKDEPFTDG
jgi:hypothetical protein